MVLIKGSQNKISSGHTFMPDPLQELIQVLLFDLISLICLKICHSVGLVKTNKQNLLCKLVRSCWSMFSSSQYLRLENCIRREREVVGKP